MNVAEYTVLALFMSCIIIMVLNIFIVPSIRNYKNQKRWGVWGYNHHSMRTIFEEDFTEHNPWYSVNIIRLTNKERDPPRYSLFEYEHQAFAFAMPGRKIKEVVTIFDKFSDEKDHIKSDIINYFGDRGEEYYNKLESHMK